MRDDSNRTQDKPVAIGTDSCPACMSRRGVLGIGAASVASALLPPMAASPAAAQGVGDPSRRLLLKDGIVLTLDPSPGNPDLAEGDVLIEGGKIRQVARNIQASDAEVINAKGMIVMPGFVDTHRHMWQGLLRNIGPDDLLGDYLKKILFGFAPVITPEEVYLGDLVAALSAMNAGITTLLDWSHIATTPAHTDAAIQALRDAKVRAVYGYGPNFGLSVPWHDPKSTSPYPNDVFRLRKEHFSSADQLLTLAMAVAGPEFAPIDAAVREFRIARQVGAPITMHVGVGLIGANNPGPGNLQQAWAQEAAGPDMTYIHCCTLNDTEWKTIKDSGGTVSLAIPIEMQMGHGNPPIQKALDFGIAPSLSVDVETNQPSDMFAQMRACFALQRMGINQQFLFGGANTPPPGSLLTVRKVLEFATVVGAKTNHLESKVGTLTAGKDADVILLKTKAINVAPITNPTGTVVLGMDSSNVDSVFIAGRAVKRNGQLVGIDVENVLRRAERAQEALLKRVPS